MKAIIGKKVGMTQIFDEEGKVIPVTVIEAGPCTVVQIKTVETDGYNAVQLGYGEVKEHKVNKPDAGHFAKANVKPTKHLREFRTCDKCIAELDGSVPLAVFPAGNFLLQEGDAGDLVYLVQVLLRLIGNHFGNVDAPPLTGMFDRETALAVRQLQEIAGLEQTGAVDRRTWDRIASLVNRMPLGI